MSCDELRDFTISSHKLHKLEGGETMDRKGLTLIELIIVAAIIAILASLGIAQYKKFQLKAKTAEVKVVIGAISSAEESYAAENGVYLSSEWAPGFTAPGCRPWHNTYHFDILGVEVEGCVYHVYGVARGDWRYRSDLASVEPPYNDTIPATDAIDISIIASGELDGDGIWSFYVSTDEDKRIIHRYDDF